jgi:predicted lipoprotein
MKTWHVPLLISLAFGGCGGSDAGSGSGGAFESWEQAQTVIDDYADGVVVSTYALLAERLHALEGAASALQTSPDAAKLDAARQAWVAAREPWEQSEGFLFGPVDANGFDPALDSWPVNRTDLDAVLASSDALTPEYVANLDPTLRGFHTAEYLIFGEGGQKTTAELTSRELDYLVAVTANMASVADDLVASWTGGDSPYAELFKRAGENNVYPSKQSAAEEMVRGMIGIADEVANGKIADPYDQKDPNLVESQFSYNSLLDFQDNVRSIQNAYTGDHPEANRTGTGLDAFVAERDPALDARVKQEIEASLAALAAIPDPFRSAIKDPEAADEIEAAQAAIRKLQSTLEQDVLTLVID